MYTLQEMAALRCAVKRNSREYLENWCDKHEGSAGELLKQYDAGEPTFIKICKVREADDYYNELWKTVEDGRCYLRHCFGIGEWMTVCDPYGYCEPDCPVKDNVIFVVCNREGNELCGSSNINPHIPTLKQVCDEEWKKIRNEIHHFQEDTERDFWSQSITGESSLKLHDWLLTFMDPELYGDEIREMYGIPQNWTGFRAKEMWKTPIHSFRYLGEEYRIYEIRFKHEVCGVEWCEYMSGRLNMGEYESYAAFHGSWFDASNQGAMYSKRVAIELVTEALKEIYKREKDRWGIMPSLSRVDAPSWYPDGYERKMSDYDAAKYLINGNYRKDNIEAVIAREKQSPSLYIHGSAELKAKFPKLYVDYGI